jgi:hypothetical protein
MRGSQRYWSLLEKRHTDNSFTHSSREFDITLKSPSWEKESFFMLNTLQLESQPSASSYRNKHHHFSTGLADHRWARRGAKVTVVHSSSSFSRSKLSRRVVGLRLYDGHWFPAGAQEVGFGSVELDLGLAGGDPSRCSAQVFEEESDEKELCWLLRY